MIKYCIIVFIRLIVPFHSSITGGGKVRIVLPEERGNVAELIVSNIGERDKRNIALQFTIWHICEVHPAFNPTVKELNHIELQSWLLIYFYIFFKHNRRLRLCPEQGLGLPWMQGET